METPPTPNPTTPEAASPEAEPAQIVAQPAAPEATEIIDPLPSFSWEASEFVHHDKPAWWYAALALTIVIICGVLGLLHQWLSIVVVVLMALAVTIYSRKAPRTLQYALDSHGVSINGRLEPYTHFRSYNVQPQLGWQEVDLEPARRFAPRLTLLADEDHFDQIEGILDQHLPRVDRDPDIIEKLSRYLKF